MGDSDDPRTLFPEAFLERAAALARHVTDYAAVLGCEPGLLLQSAVALRANEMPAPIAPAVPVAPPAPPYNPRPFVNTLTNHLDALHRLLSAVSESRDSWGNDAYHKARHVERFLRVVERDTRHFDALHGATWSTLAVNWNDEGWRRRHMDAEKALQKARESADRACIFDANQQFEHAFGLTSRLLERMKDVFCEAGIEDT